MSLSFEKFWGSSGLVEVVSYAPLPGMIVVIRGADHRYRDNTSWLFTDPGTWPLLTGATLTLTLRQIGNNQDPAPLIVTGTLLAGPPQIIYFETSASQTGALPPSANPNDYVFDIRATLANGDIYPILPEGSATVICNVGGTGLPAGQPVPIC